MDAAYRTKMRGAHLNSCQSLRPYFVPLSRILRSLRRAPSPERFGEVRPERFGASETSILNFGAPQERGSSRYPEAR